MKRRKLIVTAVNVIVFTCFALLLALSQTLFLLFTFSGATEKALEPFARREGREGLLLAYAFPIASTLLLAGGLTDTAVRTVRNLPPRSTAIHAILCSALLNLIFATAAAASSAERLTSIVPSDLLAAHIIAIAMVATAALGTALSILLLILNHYGIIA